MNEHNDFENWRIEIIDKKECEDSQDIKKLEGEWIKKI